MTESKPLWAFYCRVSSPGQAKKKRLNDPNNDKQGTLENQKEALTAWAAQHNVDAAWYIDVATGTAGVNLKQPKFLQMMSDIESKNMVGIVVAAFDRLGRDGIGLMSLTRELKAKGKELITLREGDQKLQSAMHSASNELMRDMISLISQYEKEVGVQRRREGYDNFRLNGGRVGRKPLVIDWNQ